MKQPKEDITVLVCTHNPRLDYLDRVLQNLRDQHLPYSQWELLLIDNASTPPLAKEVNLSWHPNARIIREETLGLTPARLRGISEAKTELLVFVDDDNVLEPNYLETALDIGINYTFVGAWGGLIDPEFEIQPPQWASPFLPMLAVREFTQDSWANLRYQNDAMPCGAGLCIRRAIAQHYAASVCEDSKRIGLDRKGKLLLSGGDADLALTACDLRLFTAQFTSLKLTHLIPARRLTEEYFVNLAEGMGYSHTILDSVRRKSPPKRSFWSRVFFFMRRMLMSPKTRNVYAAFKRGCKRALKDMESSSYQ